MRTEPIEQLLSRFYADAEQIGARAQELNAARADKLVILAGEISAAAAVGYKRAVRPTQKELKARRDRDVVLGVRM